LECFYVAKFNTESIWIAFKKIILDAIDMFLPVRYSVSHGSRRGPVKKYPSKIRKLMKRKLRLWRLHKLQPKNEILLSRYRQTQAECRQALQQHELLVEKQILESDDVGSFYKYVNKKMLRSSGVGTLVDDNGTLCDDNAVKANILNRYFASVCPADNGILPNVARVVPDSASLESISFTATKIMNVIKKIKPKTSCGPDGIPSLL